MAAIIQEAYYRIQDELDKLKRMVNIEKDINDYQDQDVQIEGKSFDDGDHINSHNDDDDVWNLNSI